MHSKRSSFTRTRWWYGRGDGGVEEETVVWKRKLWWWEKLDSRRRVRVLRGEVRPIGKVRAWATPQATGHHNTYNHQTNDYTQKTSFISMNLKDLEQHSRTPEAPSNHARGPTASSSAAPTPSVPAFNACVGSQEGIEIFLQLSYAFRSCYNDGGWHGGVRRFLWSWQADGAFNGSSQSQLRPRVIREIKEISQEAISLSIQILQSWRWWNEVVLRMQLQIINGPTSKRSSAHQ